MVRSFLAVLAFVGAFCVAGCAGAQSSAAEPGLEPLQIVTDAGAHDFMVEIADDDEETQRGLMFRESLADDRGMLFQFPDERERSFWMKNTYIPLDIIYIAADGRIVSIARRTTPFSEQGIPSFGAAKGVLEIRGGRAAELGVEPGDVVRHPFFANR